MDQLMNDPEAAVKLRLVDSYIAHRERAGRKFVLPPTHSELAPLIEQYSSNFPRFVQYVKDLRDTVEPRSEAYISLHELYRTLEVRLVQQQRRDRARRALDVYEKRNPKASYEEKVRWMRRVEQAWGRRRMAELEAHRRRTATGRISTEEREEILKGFWEQVDDEIKRGDV